MVELKWQNPPASRGAGSTRYDEEIEVLKANPGKWALIGAEFKCSAPPSAFRQKGCEVTARRNEGSKTWSVYARWPLPKAAPAEFPTATQVEQAKVRQAIKSGTALTPPPAAAPKRAAPAPAPAAEPVRPANDMGMSQFLAARRARGVPPEGQ